MAFVSIMDENHIFRQESSATTMLSNSESLPVGEVAIPESTKTVTRPCREPTPAIPTHAFLQIHLVRIPASRTNTHDQEQLEEVSEP
jgi:hypothetical protein